MKNPAVVIPDAMEPIKALYATSFKGGIPSKTIALVHLRASQINGCSSCVAGGASNAEQVAGDEPWKR
jgi:AhpD family alkylhydroperoxidase